MAKQEKARIKALVGRLLYATSLPKWFFRDKFVITAFHRVNNETLGDGLTCSPANFRSICTWLSKNFHVVSLHEQLLRLEAGETAPGTVSITFDDGYLDNFEHAAPILKELGLPATFFITTKLIGTDFVPYWDEKRGTHTAWMDWPQVRSLAADGFDVESHTCSHIDLGTAGLDVIRDELAESYLMLRAAGLGTKRLFAYPFGGRQHIREQSRALISEAGYRCSLSCHGGINGRGSDRFGLQRFPINEEYLFPEQLGLELLRSST